MSEGGLRGQYVSTLFGDEAVATIARKKGRSVEESLNDYDSFVDKFKPKLTTDDCYTPQEVYDALLGWINDNVMPTAGLRIMRPFRPGGDYQAEEYPGDAVVIDNPPFSILSKICQWYIERGIKFFLFAPSLTLFNGKLKYRTDITYIVASAAITYANGAVVRTSFITNMIEGGPKIWVTGDLSDMLTAASDRAVKIGKRVLPRYRYPDNIVSSALLNKVACQGISFRIEHDECAPIATMDSQRAAEKSIFGGGYLLSERATRRWCEAREAAAREVVEWPLSEREREIITRLK